MLIVTLLKINKSSLWSDNGWKICFTISWKKHFLNWNEQTNIASTNLQKVFFQRKKFQNCQRIPKIGFQNWNEKIIWMENAQSKSTWIGKSTRMFVLNTSVLFSLNDFLLKLDCRIAWKFYYFFAGIQPTKRRFLLEREKVETVSVISILKLTFGRESMTAWSTKRNVECCFI